MGFNIGPIFKACTKGIWIWSEPIMIKNSNSINDEEFPCFMIDTKGLGAYDEEVNHDSKIFLISILISYLFIYNSFGTIDENAISSLSFVFNLNKTIKLKNSFKEDNKNELAKYSPSDIIKEKNRVRSFIRIYFPESLRKTAVVTFARSQDCDRVTLLRNGTARPTCR